MRIERDTTIDYNLFCRLFGVVQTINLDSLNIDQMSLEVLGVFKSDFVPEVVLCRIGDRVGVVLVFADEFELLFDAFSDLCV